MRDQLKTNTFNNECVLRDDEKKRVLDMIMSNFFDFENA